MQKKTAEQVLLYMIPMLLHYLEELSSETEENAFTYGEKTAYTECLEWLQSWTHASAHGLDFDIEKRFPL